MSSLVMFIRIWDSQLVEGMAHRRTAFLDRLMILMTRLGDGWAWLALGLGALLLDAPHAARMLVPLGIGLAINIPLYSALKHKFSRLRPFQRFESVSCVRMPADRFSFPSGHTSVAFVVLVTAGSVYGGLLAPLALLAVLIGASRVYLGVHYPSDVLAGSVLGSVCGGLGLWLG